MECALENITVHYEVFGEGRPMIVLPGWTMNAALAAYDTEPFPGPSLIITGRQDAMAGYRDAWNILENYPRATFVVLDRAGHFLEESAGLVNVLMKEWLDRVEASVGLV